jgi:hypothetical protein
VTVPYIPKRLWRDIVNDPSFSKKDLANYYLKNVIVKKNLVRYFLMNEINRFPIHKPQIIRIPGVIEVFRKLKNF